MSETNSPERDAQIYQWLFQARNLGHFELLQVSAAIAAGLPSEFGRRVLELVAPGERAFWRTVVSRTKLSQSPAAAALRLTPVEGDRIASLARIWNFAMEGWREPEPVQEFLRRRHMMLFDQRPRDVAVQSSLGGEIVVQLIGRGFAGVAV